MKKNYKGLFLVSCMLFFLMLVSTAYAQKKDKEIIILKIGEDLESVNSNSARIGNQSKIGIITKDTIMKDCYAMAINSKGFFLYVDYGKDYEEDLREGLLVEVIEENEDTFTIKCFSNDYPQIIGKVEKSDISYDTRLFQKAEMILLDKVNIYDEEGSKIEIENFSGPAFLEGEGEDVWKKIFIGASEGPYLIDSRYIDYNYNETVKEENRTLIDVKY